MYLLSKYLIVLAVSFISLIGVPTIMGKTASAIWGVHFGESQICTQHFGESQICTQHFVGSQICTVPFPQIAEAVLTSIVVKQNLQLNQEQYILEFSTVT